MHHSKLSFKDKINKEKIASKLKIARKEDNSKRFNEKKMHQLCILLSSPQKTLQIHLDAMRDCVEMLVWGDKHDLKIVDAFLDDNTFTVIVDIVKKHKKPAFLQFLQCFAILIENIKNTELLYFLLSQNTIETILQFPIDKNDIDLISPYISMLKSISLRLTDETLQFFYNHQTNSCPILSEAVSLLNHKDSMVVSHSRNIILQFSSFTKDKFFNDYYISFSQKHFYPHLSSLILPHVHGLPNTLQILIDDVYFIADLLTLPQPYPSLLTGSLFTNLMYLHILPSMITASATSPRKIDSLQFLIHLYEGKYPTNFLTMISHCLLMPIFPNGKNNKLYNQIMVMLSQHNGMEFHCLITLLMKIIQTPPVSLVSKTYLSNPSQISAPVALLSILEDENDDDDPFGGSSTQNVLIDISNCFPWINKNDLKLFNNPNKIEGEKKTFNNEMSVYEYIKNTCKENRTRLIKILIDYCLEDYKLGIPLWGYTRILKIIKHLGWWGNGKIDDSMAKYQSIVVEKYQTSYETIAKLHPRLKKDQFDLIFNNICSNLEDISIEYEFGDNIEKWKNQTNAFIEKNFIKKQQALDIYCVIASCAIKRKLFVLFENGNIEKINEIWWNEKPKEVEQPKVENENVKSDSNECKQQDEEQKDESTQ